MPATIAIHRLYTDEAGDSRFDTTDILLALHDHSPPAAPSYTAQSQPASNLCSFGCRPAGSAPHIQRPIIA